MRKVVTSLVAASLTILLVAADGFSGVDAEVGLPLQAQGSLKGETDVLRFWAPRGTMLNLKFAAAKGHSFTDLSAILYDESNEANVLHPAGVMDAPTKIQFKGLVLPSTSWYQVSLSGEGFGDYTLTLTAKPQTVWKGESDLSGGDATVEFAASPGSTAVLTARRKPGSLTTPRWSNLSATDVSEPYDVDLSTTGKLGTTSHIATAGPLPGAEIFATLTDAGEGGTATWAVKIKTPKSKKRKLDLRGATLGKPGGGETMHLRFVSTLGGIIAVQDEDSDLFGTSIVFPEGALSATTAVSIASTPPPPIPNPDNQYAGPAVKLNAGGVAFGEPVTVTLPYDAILLPVGATGADLRVVVVEDDGEVRVEVPDSWDSGNGTVSLTTESFSTFFPIAPAGMPQIAANSGASHYWVLQFYSEIKPDEPDGDVETEDDDSRGRRLGLGHGEFTFHGDGEFEYSMQERGHEWHNVDGDGTPLLQGFPSFHSTTDSGQAEWDYGEDGESVVLSIPGAPILHPSRDGRYMVGRDDAPTSREAPGTLLLRSHYQTLDNFRYALAGTWHVGILDLRSVQMLSNGGYRPAPLRGVGTMLFDSSFKCYFSGAMRTLGFNTSTGTLSQPGVSFNSVSGSYGGVLNESTFQLFLPAFNGFPDGATLHVYPGKGMDVMFAVPELSDSPPLAFVFVKAGDAADESLLFGDYSGLAYGIVPTVYSILNIHTPEIDDTFRVGDFDLYSLVLEANFPGDGTVGLDAYRHDVIRDPLDGVLGVSIRDDGLLTPGESDVLSVDVTPAGRLSLGGSAGEAGAVTQDSMFAFAIQSPSATDANFGFAFFVKSPPPPPE